MTKETMLMLTYALVPGKNFVKWLIFSASVAFSMRYSRFSLSFDSLWGLVILVLLIAMLIVGNISLKCVFMPNAVYIKIVIIKFFVN